MATRQRGLRAPLPGEVIHHGSRRPRLLRGGGARISINLTSMIDVTFLLLVYFMIATEFKLGEEVYRLDLPQRSPAAQTADPFALDEEPLRIVVSTLASGADGYRVELDGPYEQPDDFGDLFGLLQRYQISEGNTAGLLTVDHPIIIAPTRGTSWQHAVDAFNAAAKARYTNITFAKGRG